MQNALPLLCLVFSVVLWGCLNSAARPAAPIAGGDAGKGKLLAAWYGCGSCHEIPGLAGATGQVAPPLQRIARRAYITGSVPNTPANMIRWIRNPRKVDARTIMPVMDISENDARDLAEFLYTMD